MSPEQIPLREKILQLKRERRAIILAHNYQRDEVQEIADFTGDSLELSRTAASLDCDVIVFAGVHFMAESASILCPDKTVLLPEAEAGCPMADMIRVGSPREVIMAYPGFPDPPPLVFPTHFSLEALKRQYPAAPVIAYVNTSAEVKAASDVCCTSANVVQIVESLPDAVVISVPDRNLSAWAQRHTTKKVISWDGYCHVHQRAEPRDLERARHAYPHALVMAHPECRLEVLEMADHVTSTSGMLRFAKASSAKEFVVGTELGLLYRLRRENPGKTFYPLREDMVCPDMKKTTLESIFRALRDTRHVIRVPEEIRVRAKKALDRMLSIR